MKRIFLNSFLFAVLSISVVSCAKEEVKPFCGGSHGSMQSTNTNELRDGDNTSDVIIISDEDVDGGGITDGGSSSDYDSKGTKIKKRPN